MIAAGLRLSLLAAVVALGPAGCASGGLEDETLSNGAEAVEAEDALDSFNAAFLVQANGLTYYKESLSARADKKDYFWRQALEIQMVEDAFVRTKSSKHLELTRNLLDSFIKMNGSDWSWNEFNDDLLWAGLAFVRGYQILGNPSYLTQAESAFNRAYDRGWDGALGGGLWWDIRRTEKSGLSNNPAAMLGCYLYEFTKNVSYLTKAKAIHAWVRSQLYNAATGAAYEHIKANGTLAANANVYNVGAFIGASNHLHRLTGQDSYYDDALRSVEFVKNNKTISGILSDGRHDGTWASEFARALGEFVRDNNLWSAYYPWMQQNADAAWRTRRRDLNLTGNAWATQTPMDADMLALEAVSSVVMMQATPNSQPGFASGSWYRITPKISEGSTLDIVGVSAADGAKVDIWSWAEQGNQKFMPVSLGHGYYRLVPNHAQDKSLDVFNADSRNGTVIDIWTANNSSAQAWKIVYDERGYYKLKPKAAPSSCLNVRGANPANGTPVILWQEGGGDNERWQLEAP